MINFVNVPLSQANYKAISEILYHQTEIAHLRHLTVHKINLHIERKHHELYFYRYPVLQDFNTYIPSVNYSFLQAKTFPVIVNSS